MKKLCLLLFMVVFACQLYAMEPATGVKECENGIDIDTQNKIVKIIRDFMGDEKLSGFEIERVKYVFSDFHNPKYKPNEYRVFIISDDKFQSWRVNLLYNIVTYHNFEEESDTDNIVQPKYSKEECKNIAIDWMNKKGYSLIGYDFIDVKNVEEIFGMNYMNSEFYFEYRKNKELKGLNNAGIVNIEVSTIDGKIISFLYDTDNIKPLKDEPVKESEITEIIKSFFTEEQIKGCQLEFHTNPVSLEFIPIADFSRVNDEEYIPPSEERIIIIGSADGIQNAKLGMGFNIPETLPNGEKNNNKPDIYKVMFYFDAFNKHLYTCEELLNGSYVPKDVGEKISNYMKKGKPGPKPIIEEIPFEFLTGEKLKEAKPTVKEIETILFKDNSDRVKFNYNNSKIKDLVKFENSNDIYTYVKEGKTYVFREYSPWCLVDNKPVLFGDVK